MRYASALSVILEHNLWPMLVDDCSHVSQRPGSVMIIVKSSPHLCCGGNTHDACTAGEPWAPCLPQKS